MAHAQREGGCRCTPALVLYPRRLAARACSPSLLLQDTPPACTPAAASAYKLDTMSLDFKNLIGDSGGSSSFGNAGASAMGIDGLCPSLPLKYRIIGFASCFVLGMILTFMSAISITRPVQFAVMYTIGNIVSMLRCVVRCAQSPHAHASPASRAVTAHCIHPRNRAHPVPLPDCSTMFLFGPWRQMKNMFAAKRIIATLVYLITLIATLVVAIVVKSVPLVIVMIIIQFIALVWYTLSYIPYARNLVCNAIGGCFRR
ncbi:hypothetical protein EON67_12100 [archaeon]|nr:MAG: hypothetical protein EON67_12100 [archaeon]